MTTREAQSKAKEMLGPKRYAHTRNVVRAAGHLARRWGADVQKAELAAWLHDIVKECDDTTLLQLAGQDAIIAQSVAGRPPAVWHGPCAAVYARNELGVADGEVLDAIACHTTGRERMTLLDKVLFVADFVSEERRFAGVDEIRALSEEDLDAAVQMAMRSSIGYLERSGKPLDAETIKALRALEHKDE